MKNKNSSLMQKLDLPEDLTKNGYHIEIFNSCAVIDGCRSVAEYNEGKIRLSLSDACISLIGNNLTIRSFSCSQVTVDGRICAVEIN
ncbi:MAG: YabP/YqfC family sporulation protein [Clostridia bacterium]|nr:YabP/YqfC family sporulation protein [Clostridia bacterium]